MDILILGGTGMLGHKLFQLLRQPFPETFCTIRGSLRDPHLQNIGLYAGGQVFEHVDVSDPHVLEPFLLRHKPKTLINCIGIIKQRPHAQDAAATILLNTFLPHRLAALCKSWGGQLLHISTDCVFNGRRGNYHEADLTDAEDLYGRSKALGEPAAENVLTLRTSIIGRELFHFQSLLEWFLSQQHQQVRGYHRAIYSGTTTMELANAISLLLKNTPKLHGTYQVTGPLISKFDLLVQLRKAFSLDIDIVADHQFVCDRSMKGQKFQTATGYCSPAWPVLCRQLAADPTPYHQWRTVHHEVL